ncbi:MAG: hypothetical protein HY918_05865 [Candidatus Doudnabacteria bacterium]|nr:hypothetical protein [Candidatus Doudnabacteria bacterium]
MLRLKEIKLKIKIPLFKKSSLRKFWGIFLLINLILSQSLITLPSSAAADDLVIEKNEVKENTASEEPATEPLISFDLSSTTPENLPAPILTDAEPDAAAEDSSLPGTASSTLPEAPLENPSEQPEKINLKAEESANAIIPETSVLEQDPKDYTHAELKNESVNLSIPENPISNPFALNEKISDSLALKFMPLNLNKELVRSQAEENRVIFENAFPNTDLEYQLKPDGLKENIILKNSPHPENFSYVLNLDEYDYKQVSEKEIDIYKKGKNLNSLFKLFAITAPVMYDSAGQSSDNLEFKLASNVLTLTPDKDWLTETAVYPVTVDPTITITVLNVHSHPVAGDNWQVDFTTVGMQDLLITPADQDTINDLQFTKLVCGQEDRTADAQILPDHSIFYSNWQCDDIATVGNLVLKTGNHHLLFQFGQSAEQSAAEAFNSTKVWDGGGANSRWSTAANWAGDTLPQEADTVVFDNTCAVNCNPSVDQQVFVSGFTMSTGTFSSILASTTASSTITVYGNFYMASGTIGSSFNEISISGNFTQTGGTFNAPDNLRLAGDFYRSGGTLTNNYTARTPGGTAYKPGAYPSLILEGGNQSITGNNTFGNLIKIATTTSSLSFAAGSTQTVLNTLELKGLSGNSLQLRSLSPGAAWNINAFYQSLKGLDVQDSNNTATTTLCGHGTTFTDSGRNTGWSFGVALTECFADSKYWIPNATIWSTAKNSTTLFLNGDFSYIGPNNGHAAMFDKSSFALSGTVPKIDNGSVQKIISDGSGGWYLGGDFTKVNEQYIPGLIHVLSDGSLDTGFNAHMVMGEKVVSLLLDGSTLYVGGQFTRIGGKQRFGVAALSASTGLATSWNPSADGIRGSAVPLVNALALNDAKTTLYIAGSFTHMGGVNITSVAGLNTSTGNALAWPNTAWGTGNSIAVNGSVVYFSGDDNFGAQFNGSINNNTIFAVNGTTGAVYKAWPSSTLYVPPGKKTKLTLVGSTLYYSGDFDWFSNFEGIVAINVSSSTVFNLSAWNPGIAKAKVYDVAVDGTNMYLTGAFYSSTTTNYNYFNILNNVTILDISTGTGTVASQKLVTPSIATTLAISGSSMYIGENGSMSSMGGKQRNAFAALDLATGAATDWEPWPRSNAHQATAERMVADENYVYMAGNLYGSSNERIGGILRNELAVVSATSSLAVADYPDSTGNIYSIHLSGNSVYVGGNMSDVGGAAVKNVAKLNKPGAPAYTDCSVDTSLWSETVEHSGSLPSGWTTGGNTVWVATTSAASAGTYSLASKKTADSQQTYISTTTNLSSAGIISFDYKTSSEAGYDYLLFCVDNQNCDQTNADFSSSGENNWASSTLALSQGSHVLTWKYLKDSSGLSGQDMVWIDSIKVGNYVTVPCQKMKAAYVEDWSSPTFDSTVYDVWPDATRNLVYVVGDFRSYYGSPADYITALEMGNGKASSRWTNNISFGGYSGWMDSLAKAGSNLYWSSTYSLDAGAGSQTVAINVDADAGTLKSWAPTFGTTYYPTSKSISANANQVILSQDGFSTVNGAYRMGVTSLNTTNGGLGDWVPDLGQSYYKGTYDTSYSPYPNYTILDGTQLFMGGQFSSLGGPVGRYYGIGGSEQYYLAGFKGTVQEKPEIQFSTTGSTVAESSGFAAVKLTLSATSTADTEVAYVITDGTAAHGSDYVWSMGMAGVDAGQSSTTINIPLVSDAVTESPETFQITLSSPGGTVLGANTVYTVRVVDSISPGASISPTSLSVTNPGVASSYTVVLNTQPSGDVNVSIAVSGLATTSAASLIFTSANWDTPQTVTVSALSSAVSNSTGSISHTFSSTDGNYNGLVVSDISVAITGSGSTPEPPEPSQPGGSGGTFYFGNYEIYFENHATSTNIDLANLEISYSTEATKMKFSNTPNFASSTEFAVSNKIIDWPLCFGLAACNSGLYKVYSQFYNNAGILLGSASAQINLNLNQTPVTEETIANPATNTPNQESNPINPAIVELLLPVNDNPPSGPSNQEATKTEPLPIFTTNIPANNKPEAPKPQNSHGELRLLSYFETMSPTKEVLLDTAAVSVLPISVMANKGVSPKTLLTILTSLSEAWLWILKFVQWLMSLFGLRRQKRYWGTVYDSKNKQPLDPVMVELYDVKTGKKLEQVITDMFGRFGFLSERGQFRLVAKKTNYLFPSKNIIGPRDQIYDNLYFGGDINIGGDDVISPNVPMDPLAFDWNQMDKQRIVKFHPTREIILKAVINSFFTLGFIWSIFVAWQDPGFWHNLVVGCYALVLAVQLLWPQQRLWGRVFEQSNMLCQEGLVLELSHPNLPVVIAKAKTDKNGKFFLKAVPGSYSLKISRVEGEQKIPIVTMDVAVGKIGCLNSNIGI